MENDTTKQNDAPDAPSEALRAIQKKYVLIGQSKIKPWQTWLILGLVAGVGASIFWAANQKGKTELSRASYERREAPPPPSYVPGEIIVKMKESGSTSQGIAPFSPTDPVSVEKTLRGKYQLPLVKKVLGSHKFKGMAAAEVSARGLDRLYLVKVPQGVADAKALDDLRKDPAVAYAEPNYIMSTLQVLVPNDPAFSKLWGMDNTGQTGGAADADIDAPEAWTITKSSSVTVGVIDTGVDYNHEDLKDNVWKNPGETPGDGIDNDQNGFIDDVYGWDFVSNDNDPMDDMGHGTHVAGTIGAAGNNGVGVAGVNWKASIAAIKFLNSGGSGTIAAAVQAVQYANLMGFKITSNSWGGGGFSQALYDAIGAANGAGYLFVAAAGNSSGNSDQSPMYPAAYDLPNIISVAATDHNDAKAGFSNYGLKSVDLGAPGVDTFSTVPKSNCALCDPSGYRMLSGTSMATPHVSGAAALFWAYKPAFTHLQVKDVLLGTADPLAALQGKTVSGGRLNLNNLFEVDTVPPSLVNTLIADNPTHSSVILKWTAVGDDGLKGTASRYDIRYSTSPINSGNFDLATQTAGAPKPAVSGTKEQFKVTGLQGQTTYYFAMKVYDNMGNASPLSNAASKKTLTAKVVFSDNMESPANKWTVAGSDGKGGSALWHVSQRRSVSSSHAQYYGQESTGNYDTGAVNFGTITSPVIDLSSIVGAELSFQHYLDTEGFAPFDKATVEVSKDDGTTWTPVFTKTTTNGAWVKETVDLSAFDFSKINIRFSFDTVDAFLNQFEGWFIDDVIVSGLPSANKKPIANAGGPYKGAEDQPITFDGSKSSDPDGKPLTYSWDFGDGSTIVGQNPTVSYAYAAGGTYTVTLIVNDGAFDSAPSKTTATVSEVDDPPVAQILFGPPLVGYPLTFDGTASYDIDNPLTSYAWDMGDGNTKQGRLITHAYAQPGLYQVTLTVTGGATTASTFLTLSVDLFDMFDRQDSTTLGNGWQEAKGDFSVSEQELKNATQGGAHLAVLPTLKDAAAVYADFAYTAFDGGPRLGVVLRYQDPNNFYLFYRQAGSGGREVRISKFVGGKETILAKTSVVDPAKNVFFKLQAGAQGSQLMLALDGGIKKLSVTDSTFASGLGGILVQSAFGISHRIDNVRATGLTEKGKPPPPTPPPAG